MAPSALPWFPTEHAKSFCSRPKQVVKLFTASTPMKKAELEDALFWLKQGIAIFCGILLAYLHSPVIGSIGIAGGMTVLLTKRIKTSKEIPDEVMDENKMLLEGLGPAFQTFLVAWIASATAFAVKELPVIVSDI